MEAPRLDIHKSKKGPYYEMYINGQFYGNYDTVKEASDDYEEYRKEEQKKEEATA